MIPDYRNSNLKDKKTIAHLIKILETMKKKEKKKNKKNNEKLQKPNKDISALIDELAYVNENENIRKSKRFLDDIYILDQD